MPQLPPSLQKPVQPPFSSPVLPISGALQPKRLPPEFEQLESKISGQISDISARLKLLEQRVDGLRGHIELVDNSLIEKHKTVIGEIRDVQDGMRALRADIDMLKDLTERLAKRMEVLASREEVKVLQRYVELWQPLQFVTRAEVKALVQNALKEQGIKMKIKEAE